MRVWTVCNAVAFFFPPTANFYFLHGQLDALLCGNSSDSGYVTVLARLQLFHIYVCINLDTKQEGRTVQTIHTNTFISMLAC